VGKEKLEFPSGPFAFFGINALLCGCETAEQVLQDDTFKDPDTQSTHSFPETAKKKASAKQYVPDFSLRVDERCVYMKIDRDLWRNGVIKSRFELMNNQKSDSIDYLPCGHKSESDLDVSLTLKMSSKESKSPRVSFFKSITDKSPSSSDASANNGKLNSRRSTIAASALQKIQDLTGKRSKTHLDQLAELSDSQELVGQADKDSLVISEEIINETEPFLNKKYSTSSQTLDNQKSANSTEMYTTLSQKSFND